MPWPGFRPAGRPDERGLWLPHPSRGYVYRPSFHGVVGEPPARSELAINELGMRERAELLGGTPDVDTGSLGGVTVTARIPQQQPLHSTDLEKKPVDKRPAEKEHPA